MIELTGLRKQYGQRTVLDIPALTFRAGERYALVGPNGSGKSTLLRILAGVLRPDGGSVTWEGVAPAQVGYLPQKPYAFDLPVLENVMLGCTGDRAARRARAMDALRRLELEPLAAKRGNRLSGGETQRMALARLLAGERKLLLLDEPAAAADIHAGGVIEAALLRYAAERGCTLIFSSHAPGQALRLGTQAIVLTDGRVAETGPAARVLRAPESAAAQTFLREWTV